MSEKRVASIHGLDLSMVVSDLIRSGVDAATAIRAVSLYRDFLVTIADHPTDIIVPTKLVDKAWHAHMCRPKKYYQDCMRAFGEIIDHTPGVTGTVEYEAAYSATRALASFGKLMPEHPYANDEMAGADCYRAPNQPSDPEDPLAIKAA